MKLQPSPDVSIVVPLFNEEPNVTPLVERTREAMGTTEMTWELVLVDDGSDDGTGRVAAERASEDSRVRLLRLSRNYGQSSAMQAGFDRSDGDVVVTLDGDLQNDPGDIPRLVGELDTTCDLVAGYRADRKEGLLTRRLPSRAANGLIRWLTGVDIRDNGCTLRAYRRSVVERLSLYAEQHRFIVPLAVATAGARTKEIPVQHRERQYGESKYGLSRTWRVLVDLVTLKLLRSFRTRPFTFFGAGAMALALIATLFGAAELLLRLGVAGAPLDGSFVFPSAGLLTLGSGVFLAMLGLIAEVALRGRWDGPGLQEPTIRELSS